MGTTEKSDILKGIYFVPIRGGYIGISDILVAYLRIEDKVRMARCCIRDEANHMTWVKDALMGFIPNPIIIKQHRYR